MTIWISIICAGLINYATRLGSVLIINPKKLGKTSKEVLSYVPSAVFPAIIFPAIFFNDYGNLIELSDPKIYGAIIAIAVGYLSRNIIATIFSGLISYWIIIFLI